MNRPLFLLGEANQFIIFCTSSVYHDTTSRRYSIDLTGKRGLTVRSRSRRHASCFIQPTPFHPDSKAEDLFLRECRDCALARRGYQVGEYVVESVPGGGKQPAWRRHDDCTQHRASLHPHRHPL